jgi:alkane 1-monooxygenase
MDHRVLAHYGGDLGLANVHPPALHRLREHQRRHPTGRPEATR